MTRVLPRPPLAADRAEPMLARQLDGGQVLPKADWALVLHLLRRFALLAVAVEECHHRRSRQTGLELARERIAERGKALVDGQPWEPVDAIEAIGEEQ
jgi:hypothetical protein